MIVSLDPAGVALLLAAGLAAGFINTVAGGGSLLTLPALMLVGLDASVANGTNRVSILIQTAVAADGFRRSGHLPPRVAGRLLVPTLVGAGAGALTAALMPDAVLEPVLLTILVAMAIVLTVRPSLLAPTSSDEAAREPGPGALAWLAAAGFYGGFVQAGMGFVLLAILAGALRYDLVRANGLKALLVLALTVLALGVFLAAGLVRWMPGLVVALGAIVGARAGVHVAVRRPHTLRWLLLVAVVASTAALALRP